MMLQRLQRCARATARSTAATAAARRKSSSAVETAVYTWGVGSGGQLGHAKFELEPGFIEESYVQAEPRRLVKSKQYRSLAMAETFTLALTETGHLCGWGQGFLGTDSASKEPQVFPGTTVFRSIACGKRHAAAVDKDGMVHTWGYGGSWMGGGGQLGHNSTDAVSAPKLVEAFQRYGAKAQSVSMGSQHTLILTTDGEVLSCGVGEYGRLGTGNTGDSLVPAPLETLLDEDVVQAVAGHSHSVLLTSSGKCFTFGRNDTGALGHADSYIDIYSMEEFPRHLESKELAAAGQVVQVGAGRGTSAALTSEGKLFLWGRHLGHVPTLVPNDLFDGLRVKKVALGGEAGRGVVAVVTEDDGLWTFGDGASKMLGLPKASTSSKHPNPCRVPSFVGRRTLDIFCGPGQHMAAIVATGNS